MTTPAKGGPVTFPCTTAPGLFDSTKGPEDRNVQKAQEICWTCPVMAACREQGRQNREWGIWGGESLPERYAALGLVEADFLVPACETEMAYRRHRAMNEDCVECRMAHNARMVAYDQAARARREAKQSEANAAREAARLAIEATRPSPEHAPLRPQCGTAHGYKVHCKNRELSLIPHPECTCRAAHAAKRKGERRAGKVKPMELAAAA